LAGILSLINVVGGIIYYESNLNETKEDHNYQIIKNTNSNDNEEEYNQININKKLNFFTVIKNKKILIPLFLVLFFSSTPSYFESSFYYLSDMKGFNPRNFGELTIYIMILMLGISLLYKNYLKSFNKRKIIFWAILISFFCSCFFNVYLYFNLSSKIIVILSISLYVTIKSICSKPMLDLAFLSCPKGYEGSVMGLFGSALSFGKTISTFLGSLLTSYFKIEKTNYNNFNILILVHNLISLASMVGLFFITDDLLEMKENGKINNLKENKNLNIDHKEIGVDIYNEKTKLKEAN
jgi:predicted MFS family arabinose efflux permease